MNVLILEDELHTAALLKEMIENDSDFFVTQIIESVADAVPYLVKYQDRLDLLFFDIQLADGKSFEIFKHVDVCTPVVFCTAYDEFTLKAIKNNGIDYILKPFKEQDVIQALKVYKTMRAKLGNTTQATPAIQLLPTKSFQQNFLTQYKSKTLVVDVNQIACFSLEFETVFLYTLKGDKYPIYKKMDYIESVCNPEIFFRINRKMLVRRGAVKSFEPYFNRKIALNLLVNTPERPVVSRLKVTKFKQWLEQ